MAETRGGRHELVLSSDRPLDPAGEPPVRPSSGITDSGTQNIYFYDVASHRITHYWSRVSEGWKLMTPQ